MSNYILRLAAVVICLALSLALSGCGVGGEETPYLDISVCDPSKGPFSLEITNPYMPLAVGNEWVLEGREDGADIIVKIAVLDKTEEVAGITTRVVREMEWEDAKLIEVSWNYFVQAEDGTVCYFGEDVDIYKAGLVVSHEGAWRAGRRGGKPGIMMPAHPKAGDRFKQEVAPGIAEDEAEVISIGRPFKVQAGAFKNTLRTIETTPLEPGVESEKRFAARTGLIVDDKVELAKYDVK